MKTAGKILKESRVEKQIRLDQVAKETKIRKKYLIALEKDDYQSLPSVTTTKGFIRNYAQYLGLNSEKMVAVFKRDCQRIQEQKQVFPFREDLNKQFKWSPRKSLFLIIILFVFSLLTYFGYQYHGLLGKPNLEVYSPIDNQQFSENQIIVKGKIAADNSVSVNGNLTQVSDQGEFSYRLLLSSGENEIIIEVANRLGRKNKQVRTVYYNKTN